MTPLLVGIRGIGAWSADHGDWPSLSAALLGKATGAAPGSQRPAAPLLPPAERRRAPDGVAVALHVADEAATAAGVDRAELASVFVSAHGDLAIVDYLCTTLACDPAALSPTRFHLSVHNAAAGYWSIAAADRAPSTSIAGGGNSFAAGLLEAATMALAERRPVLLVAFDTRAVGILGRAARNTALFGFAVVLDPRCDDAPLRLTLTVVPGAAPPDAVPEPLAALQASSPAAHALVLARVLAVGAGRATLSLGDDLAMNLSLQDRQPRSFPQRSIE